MFFPLCCSWLVSLMSSGLHRPAIWPKKNTAASGLDQQKKANKLFHRIRTFFCRLHPSSATLFSSSWWNYCVHTVVLFIFHFLWMCHIDSWAYIMSFRIFDLQTEKNERKRVLLLCCTTLCAFPQCNATLKSAEKDPSRSVALFSATVSHLTFSVFPTVDPPLSFQFICFWCLFNVLILEILCVKRMTIEWMPRLNIAQYKCSEGHINPGTTVAINLTNYLPEHLSNWMSFGLIAFWSNVSKEQTEKEKNILNKQKKNTMNHHSKVATFFIIPSQCQGWTYRRRRWRRRRRRRRTVDG